MFEKVLFKKIELWIAALFVLGAFVAMVLFGWVVRITVLDPEKTGVPGEIALSLSEIPSNLRKILKPPPPPPDNDRVIDLNDINAYDFVSKSAARMFPLDNYRRILPDSSEVENPPLIWSTAKELQPLSVLLRVNDDKDEKLVVLDNRRNMVASFDIKVRGLRSLRRPPLSASETLLLDDGSMIVFPIGSPGLYRMSVCGRILWTIDGIFHHNFVVDEGRLYILGVASENLSENELLNWNENAVINVIDVHDGTLLRSVNISDIATKNIKRFDPLLTTHWLRADPPNPAYIHVNKIDVLPARMAAQYPGLPAGTWLLSMRDINLVMAVHPDTLDILWFDHGNVQMQHDPHFVGNGRISVFNNASRITDDVNNPEIFSSLKTYDFKTRRWSESLSGKDFNAFSFHMGNFDLSARGDYLFNVSTQGRFLEISPDGKLISEILNLRDKDSVYWTKHAQYLTDKQFQRLKKTSCD